MNTTNFKLVRLENQPIIEIDFDGKILDLHNAAEFLGIEYVIKSSYLTLFWKYYFDDESTILFQIVFERVSCFEVLPRDVEMPISEDDCLEEIICDKKFQFKFMGGMLLSIEAMIVSLEMNQITK